MFPEECIPSPSFTLQSKGESLKSLSTQWSKVDYKTLIRPGGIRYLEIPSE